MQGLRLRNQNQIDHPSFSGSSPAIKLYLEVKGQTKNKLPVKNSGRVSSGKK